MEKKDLEKCEQECIDKGYSREEAKRFCSKEDPEKKEKVDFESDL